MNDFLTRLAEPFEPKHVTWKPGATKGDKCMALAYADLRAYMTRLDEVCGADWSVAYEPWGQDRLICRLTIGGVVRSSTGEMSAQEAKGDNGGTTAEAQSFKRASAMFGLGRHLYDLPSIWVDFDPAAKRISKAGQTELDRRYAAWYAKTMAAKKPPQGPARVVDTTTGEILGDEGPGGGESAAQAQSEGDILFSREDDPTDAELTIVGDWRSRKDAEMWAIMVGACLNEYEAKNSLDKVVARHGGKVTMDNVNAIYLDFVRRQREKLAQQSAPVANGKVSVPA